jgi:hypothetical protein
LYLAHFVQRRWIWIDDGGDRSIPKPADGSRVLSSHLSGAKDSNAQLLGRRNHLRLSMLHRVDSG